MAAENIVNALNFGMRFLRESKRIISPLDSWSLRLHSPVGSGLLLMGFGLIVSEAFADNEIKCMKGRGGVEDLKDTIVKELCTSYSFGHMPLEGRQTLIYRWVPYLLGVLAIISHLPQKLRSRLEMRKLSRNVEALLHSAENEAKEVYIQENLGGHGEAMRNSFIVSVCCLLCDVASVYILEVTLKNMFLTIPRYFPLRRHWDLKEQSEYLRLFPITTKCVLSPDTGGMAGWNTLYYGCILPLNVYYEKVFVGLFFLYSILTLSSVISLLRKVTGIPCRRKNDDIREEVADVIHRRLYTNERWVLEKIRKFATNEEFIAYLNQAYSVLQNENLDIYHEVELSEICIV